METIIAIIFVIFGILQIILFFKIWGMTNDVKALCRQFVMEEAEETIIVKPAYAYKVGDVVFCNSLNKEGVIKGYDENNYWIEFSDGRKASVIKDDLTPKE